jgi:tetratricopeptide (TPR) repeat protein
MVRNMPLLVVTALPGVVWGFAPRVSLRRGPIRGVALVVLAVSLVLGLRVASDAYYVASRRVERFGLGWNRLALPVAAAARVAEAGIAGPMLNYLSFGGTLMWTLPDPVFIDGRLEVVGEEFYEYYREIFDSPAALEAAVARWGIRWIVFPYAERPALLDALSRDPRWRLAHVDPLAVIFVRAHPGVEHLVGDTVRAELGSPAAPVSLSELPGLGAARRVGPARRFLEGLVRRERFPADELALGLFHYFRGDPARAAPRFAAGIRASGGAYYELYANLAAALYRQDRLAEAAACYRIVLQDDPANARAHSRLAEIDRRLR